MKIYYKDEDDKYEIPKKLEGSITSHKTEKFKTVIDASQPFEDNVRFKRKGNKEAFVVYDNGDTYEGFIRNNKKNGFGVFVSK